MVWGGGFMVLGLWCREEPLALAALDVHERPGKGGAGKDPQSQDGGLSRGRTDQAKKDASAGGAG